MKSFFIGLGSAAALPALALLSGCAAALPNPSTPVAVSSDLRKTTLHKIPGPTTGQSDGPSIMVENQWSSTIHFATTVDGDCQPWIPAKGAVDAGGYEMMNGQPRYSCGAQISFGPATDDGAQTCILHWSGDLFLVQQGASTDCDFTEDTGGITFYYRLGGAGRDPVRFGTPSSLR